MEIRMTARLTVPLIALVLALAFTATAKADDKAIDGTWKTTIKAKDGTERTITYKFKLEGEKVTGTVIGRDNKETAIEEGKIKDGALTFSLTREINNNKATFKYEGKLDGDIIKGTREGPGRDGAVAKRDWE